MHHSVIRPDGTAVVIDDDMVLVAVSMDVAGEYAKSRLIIIYSMSRVTRDTTERGVLYIVVLQRSEHEVHLPTVESA